MKIAYWTDFDSISGLSPTQRRAIEEAANALREQGHEVVEYETSILEEIMGLFPKYFF